MMPNFFVVGAAKSGTTSLWEYLLQHPEIFLTENKEPSYFCEIYGYNNRELYLQLFKDAEKFKARGEASHAYLTSPESAAWIHREIPDAKIIIILRNPIDRAYSLYRWMVNHGYEWIYPFEKALDAEKHRKADPAFYKNNQQYFYNYLYFESGLYSEQLNRYFCTFPFQQIKIVLFEDLILNPVETVQSIYEFLGTNRSYVPMIEIHNKSDYRPMFIALHNKLLLAQKRYRGRSIGKLAMLLFQKNLQLKNEKWPKLGFETRALLINGYRDDIGKTSRIIDRDLSGWLK